MDLYGCCLDLLVHVVRIRIDFVCACLCILYGFARFFTDLFMYVYEFVLIFVWVCICLLY